MEGKKMLAAFLPLLLSLACSSGGGVPDGSAVDEGGIEPADGQDGGIDEAADAASGDDYDGGAGDSDADAGHGERTLRAEVLLGRGGFFGVSGTEAFRLRLSEQEGFFAIGAHYEDISGGGEPVPAGRVYLFSRLSLPQNLSQAALVLEPPDGAAGGGFGWALSAPCDLNGDGQLDLAVGNHLYSTPEAPNSGRVVVFWGDPQHPFAKERATLHTLPPDIVRRSDAFGQTVLCADLDGDGRDDLAAGGQNAGLADTGLVGIFHGAGGQPPATADQLLEPALSANRQYFGSALLFGDLDGDGARDLAVGGWGLIKGAASGGPHTGGICLFRGNSSWESGPAGCLYPPEDEEMNFGVPLALAETPTARLLLVGASAYGADDRGAVFVYRTGPQFWLQEPWQVLVSPHPGDTGFPSALLYLSDFGGTGRGALLVGAKYADPPRGESTAGAVAVYRLEADGLTFSQPPEWLSAPAPKTGDGFGAAIVSIGDIDGDGFSDFFVGMPEHLEGDIYTGTQTGGVIFFH